MLPIGLPNPDVFFTDSDIVRVTKERLEEIKAFVNTDFSDCPELTDEQLAQMKPSHLRNMANDKPIKKTPKIIQRP